MSTLIFFTNQQQLFEFQLSNARSLIGRSDSCDIALPGETLSRIHCVIEKRGPRWFLIDQSRHGTWRNQQRVSRVQLKDNDEFVIGAYRVIFRANATRAAVTTQQSSEPHKFITNASEELIVTQAVLHVENGPMTGKAISLNLAMLTVGGMGSDVVLSEQLKPNHCRLRISRGRAMVEPGSGPVYLDGRKVQDITPLYSDETI